MSEEFRTPALLEKLPAFEKGFMAVLAGGIILAVLKIDLTILKIGLVGLAVIFFASAFRLPAPSSDQENGQYGFSDLLASSILPKVLWISSAISTIAIALYFIKPENQGYRQMLFIGTTTAATALVILTFFLISGAKHLKAVVPILYRAIPVLIAGLYFFLK